MAANRLTTALRGSYTPLYASPQQRAGGPPDPRDDVHALGVIGYQMLTGRLDQAPGIDAADDLRDAGAGDGLIAVLTKCVAQKPERRPKDAAELAEKLAELMGTVAPAQASPSQSAPSLPSPLAGEGGEIPRSGMNRVRGIEKPHLTRFAHSVRKPPSPARGEG